MEDFADEFLESMHGNYTEGDIPTWCRLPKDEHLDNMFGCWGIAYGYVKEEGINYCKKCEYFKEDIL